MRVMLLTQIAPITNNSAPLEGAKWPQPEPAPGEVLIRVSACGVCHTDLHVVPLHSSRALMRWQCSAFVGAAGLPFGKAPRQHRKSSWNWVRAMAINPEFGG